MVSEIYAAKNVCVIGAGPSGLVAARELRKEGQNVVVLEQNHDIGGQWLYDPKVEDEDPLGKGTTLKVHSSMYDSLRLASPREIMGFTDFPFVVKKGRDMRRFPGHNELLLYLKDFCECFGLREMVRFNTRVEYVGMLDYAEFGKNLRWVVKSKEKNSEEVVEEVFDAVVVATGHYSHPRLPAIKGMDAWRRKQMHSHVYRTPEPFRNEDLAMELVGVANEIHLSTKVLDVSEGLSEFISAHGNLHLHPQIDSLHEDGRVGFVDGSWVTADTIIYCTGYLVPLFKYKHASHGDYTSSIITAPSGFLQIIGFPFFESQAKWIAQLLSGKTKLPSWDEMMQSIKEFYHLKEIAGVPKHNTHDIADFEYCDQYCDQVGFPHLEEWRKDLCRSALRNSYANLEKYRDVRFVAEN
ncbi:hypothetical protein RJ640_003308 [Escallonia rubra]|uniref:Flavin-containing monooxygenase n=1 Tax=Escallonia rubra TaxID=112253 RepID=A0AA88QVY7_9ASTE|nr:hypothetical protein RJ640_003308 [Escallonia rubra]